MMDKIKQFNWWRIILPLTTYYKLKNHGFINPVLFLIDLIILFIPFSTIAVVLLVKYVLNDVDKD